ncbi:MAG: polyphosphate kinase 1 [Longimicrobiales bacterium]|nr:polyphosphate kinase 1 [Longimicrobiales bacterium]
MSAQAPASSQAAAPALRPVGVPVYPSTLRSGRVVPDPGPRPEAAEAVDRWEETGDSLRTPPRAVRPRPVGPGVDLGDPVLYFNRELSWLDFNWRVLHQARDERTPLLERVRFLSITQSNLDEFVRKRVGGLKRQKAAGVTELSPDGRSPGEQLDLIREAILEMQEAMSRTWRMHLVPALRREGIYIRSWGELDEAQRDNLRGYFRDHVYPILTPLAVDPGHPFPFISNQSLSLAVVLQNPGGGTQFARVKVPLERGRWVPLDDAGGLLPVEELVAHNVHELFPGTRILHVHAFRVTRNADLSRDDEEAEDLLQMISEELRERRFAPVVRLEVEAGMPEQLVGLLRTELALDERDVYRVHGTLDFTDLSRLDDGSRPDLGFRPWEPVTPPELRPVEAGACSIFDVLLRGDVLVHHPYDSFRASVQRFVEEAAEDPRVVAIKLTLYRTSEDSPVVKALIRAAEAGKQVAVLVEVLARFDEARNIEWGQLLEQAGVHVTYGLVGLKTHTKVTLVVRDEDAGIRTYAHVGTGNYHAATARLYTDLGLLTADPDIGLDLVRLFHYLTGHAPEQHYRSLVVAPRDMRAVFEGLVAREIQHQERTGQGRIIVKMNALDDVAMIQALYRASMAGVSIDLIIRGHSRLRPGLAGISDNIRVTSIIGRFLEHDRIFYFRNAGDPDILLGSADWRRRNLEERVEAVVRIRDPGLRERLENVLHHALWDNRLAWELKSDGAYRLRIPQEGEPVRSFHDLLMADAEARARMGEEEE